MIRATQPRWDRITSEAGMSVVSSITPAIRYSATQRLLHWAMALIIFTAIGLGLYASYLQIGTPLRRELLFIQSLWE